MSSDLRSAWSLPNQDWSILFYPHACRTPAKPHCDYPFRSNILSNDPLRNNHLSRHVTARWSQRSLCSTLLRPIRRFPNSQWSLPRYVPPSIFSPSYKFPPPTIWCTGHSICSHQSCPIFRSWLLNSPTTVFMCHRQFSLHLLYMCSTSLSSQFDSLFASHLRPSIAIYVLCGLLCFLLRPQYPVFIR